MPNPGLNGRTLADFNTPTFRSAIKSACLDANINAPTGQLVNESFTAAAAYGANQYGWDWAFGAVMARAFGNSYSTRAKGWADNWRTRLTAQGMKPIYIGPSGDDENRSQTPLDAWAVWDIWQGSGASDTVWLEAQYGWLKTAYAWWETHRQGPDGLATNGSQSANVNNFNGYASTEAFDDIGPFFTNVDDNYFATSGQYASYIDQHDGTQRADYAFPELNAVLVDYADKLSLMATVLGHSADATTYAAKRDARKALMNRVLWDEEQGLYGMVLDDSLATVLTVAAGAAAGATSVSVTVPSAGANGNIRLVDGAKAVFSGGATSQVSGHSVLPSGTQTLTLKFPLDSAVAAGETVRVRQFLYIKHLPALMFPLWAGIADSAKAARIVNEHLLKVYDGSEDDTMDCTMAPANYGNRCLKMRHTGWKMFVNANANALYHAPTAAVAIVGSDAQANSIIFTYRFTDAAAYQQYTYHDETLEQIDANHPLVVNVQFAANGVIFPTARLRDKSGAVIATQSAVSSGSSGSEVWTATFTDTCTLGYVEIGRTAGNGGLAVERVAITTRPRGYVYRTPFGLLCNPRLGPFSFSVPYDSPRDFGGQPSSNHSSYIGNVDYWKGDQWMPLTYLSLLGLQRYGYNDEATSVALDTVAAWYNEWQATGEFYERMGQRGATKGAVNYGWTGLLARIMDEIPAVTAILTPGSGPVGHGVTSGIISGVGRRRRRK